MSNYVICRFLNLQNYGEVLQAMQQFTLKRNRNTIDEIWFLEHFPVFTLGKASKMEHIIDPQDIPVVPSDRGGQVTYHGPGQIIVYFLIDLIRKSLSLKKLINLMLESVIIFLRTEFNLNAELSLDLPGVYINQGKICSLGLKIHKGCSYHGLSLNIDMNLNPFKLINPCGIKSLDIIQLSDLIKEQQQIDLMVIKQKLKDLILLTFNYIQVSLEHKLINHPFNSRGCDVTA